MNLDYELPDFNRPAHTPHKSGRAAVQQWLKGLSTPERLLLGLPTGDCRPHYDVCLYVCCADYDPQSGFLPLDATLDSRGKYERCLKSLASADDCFRFVYDKTVTTTRVQDEVRSCAQLAGRRGSLLAVFQGHCDICSTTPTDAVHCFVPAEVTSRKMLLGRGIPLRDLWDWFNAWPVGDVQDLAVICDFCHGHVLLNQWSWRQAELLQNGQGRTLIVTSSDAAQPRDGGFFNELVEAMVAREEHTQGLRGAYDRACRNWEKGQNVVRGHASPTLKSMGMSFPLRRRATA